MKPNNLLSIHRATSWVSATHAKSHAYAVQNKWLIKSHPVIWVDIKTKLSWHSWPALLSLKDRITLSNLLTAVFKSLQNNSGANSQSISGWEIVLQHYSIEINSAVKKSLWCDKLWSAHPLYYYGLESLEVVLDLRFTKSICAPGCLLQEWQQQGNLTPAQSIVSCFHYWVKHG